MKSLLVQHTLANFSFFLLFLVTVWVYSEIFFNIKLKIESLPFNAMFLVFVLFFLIFIDRFTKGNHFPISNLYESYLVLSLILSCIYLRLKKDKKKRFKIIDFIIPPFLLFFTGFANYVLPSDLQKTFLLVPALQSNWLVMHVTIMMGSYAVLIIGSLLAFSFLVVGLFQNENYRALTGMINGSDENGSDQDEKDLSDSSNGLKVPPNPGNGSPLKPFSGNGSSKPGDDQSELSKNSEKNPDPKQNLNGDGKWDKNNNGDRN